jgi:formylmethanofuran dehydrogenase subunit B
MKRLCIINRLQSLQRIRLKSMVWLTQSKSSLAVQPLVAQIIASGQMSRKEHIQLTSAILSDQQMTNEDRQQINRVFDYIQIGRLRLID